MTPHELRDAAGRVAARLYLDPYARLAQKGAAGWTVTRVSGPLPGCQEWLHRGLFVFFNSYFFLPLLMCCCNLYFNSPFERELSKSLPETQRRIHEVALLVAVELAHVLQWSANFHLEPKKGCPIQEQKDYKKD